MFQKPFPTRSTLYLRALEGAPLICLFFLCGLPLPVTQGLIFAQGRFLVPLSQLSSYNLRTVRAALALLGGRTSRRPLVPAYRPLPRDRASPLNLRVEILHQQSRHACHEIENR